MQKPEWGIGRSCLPQVPAHSTCWKDTELSCLYASPWSNAVPPSIRWWDTWLASFISKFLETEHATSNKSIKITAFLHRSHSTGSPYLYHDPLIPLLTFPPVTYSQFAVLIPAGELANDRFCTLFANPFKIVTHCKVFSLGGQTNTLSKSGTLAF